MHQTKSFLEQWTAGIVRCFIWAYGLNIIICRIQKKNEFILGHESADSPISINRSASHQLSILLHKQAAMYDVIVDGLTGLHSNRKFGTTCARSNGCLKDEVDHRGCWKGDKRQQDGYASTPIPYVDAKVCASLCKGGPITYIVKERSGINDQWILDYVVPTLHQRSALNNVNHRIHRQVCLVLGRALLWKIFDACRSKLPLSIIN